MQMLAALVGNGNPAGKGLQLKTILLENSDRRPYWSAYTYSAGRLNVYNVRDALPCLLLSPTTRR